MRQFQNKVDSENGIELSSTTLEFKEYELELSEKSEKTIAPTYLGDGVYAEFDGYQIWLKTDAGRIAIEPQVWSALRQFALFINTTYNVKYFEFGTIRSFE